MAVKPITLELAGDEDKLVKAFKNVGKATDKLEDEFEDTQKKAGRLGSALDKTAGAADASESKFMGTADILSGLGGAFGLPTEKAGALFQAFGDLSGGFAQVGPLISSVLGKLGIMTTATAAQATATGAATGAQTGLNVAMLANPIGLIVIAIVALIGVFILLWTKVDGFREALTGAFKKVMDFIPGLGLLGSAVGFVSGLFGKHGDKVKDTSARYAEAFAEMGALLEAQRGKWVAWHDGVSNLIDDIQNPLQRAREQSKISFTDINQNLIDNQKFFEGWINNLTRLQERGFGALASKMFELGPTAEKAVGEMMSMSDPVLRKLEGRFAKAGDTANRVFTGAFLSTESLAAMGDAGAIAATSFKNGFTSGGAITIAAKMGPAVAVPLRAAGGPVGAGMPYLVGEAGPELFVPGSNGTIIPNGGGGTTTIYLSTLDPAGAGPLVVRALDEYESRNGARYARV